MKVNVTLTFSAASGGHYTSYSKNPKTDSWHYFNDDSVTNKSPSKDEFSSGYILFYAKKGQLKNKCIDYTIYITDFQIYLQV